MRSLESNFGFRGLRGRELGSNTGGGATSHLIRSAEKLAASGKFESAMEQLNNAQRLDPENKYIQAIMDRIHFQQNRFGTGETSAPLSVTVGKQFQNGIKSEDEEESLSPDQIHSKVRSLTNMAEKLLEKGSSDKAFEMLMKAYLLDPVSPYVIASEKTVLPAWEFARHHGGESGTSRWSGSGSSTTISEMEISSLPSAHASTFKNPLSPQSGQVVSSTDEHARMEILKQQKERERFEKERTVWREASKAPRTFGESDQPMDPPSPESEPQKPQTGSLFSRLKLGKFLE